MRKFLLLLILLATGALAQISNPIRVIYVATAPTVGGACVGTAAMQRSLQSGATNGHLYSCQSSLWVDITGAGGASGTVTQVVIAGTANQIQVSGTCTITTTGTCTLSIPTDPTLPGNTTGTFIGNLTGTASAVPDSGVAFTDVTTNDVSSSKHGFAPKSPADSSQFLNGGATPAFSSIQTAVITAMTALHANDTFITAAGTAYVLTATPAAVTFGTTSPVITLGAAGTWLIMGSMAYTHASATYSSDRVITGTFNRTNNTPASLAGGLNSHTGVITTSTGDSGFPFNSFIYTTSNTNDSITLFASVAVLPSAGATNVSFAKITAIRLY